MTACTDIVMTHAAALGHYMVPRAVLQLTITDLFLMGLSVATLCQASMQVKGSTNRVIMNT